MANPQFDARRRLMHVLTVEGMPRVMLSALLDGVDHYAGAIGGALPADPQTARAQWVWAAATLDTHLAGAVELAATLAGGVPCRWVPIAPQDAPARVAALVAPGEILMLSHGASGAAHAVAACVPSGARVINLGDGLHAQPLAALADVAALRRRLPDLHTLRVLLVGDLRRDARLRGVIHILSTLGTPELRVLHTAGDVPAGAAQLGVHACAASEGDQAMAGADAVLTYSLPAAGQPGRMVMHGTPSAQAFGPPVAEPMAAEAALACALAAASDALETA